MIKNLNKLGAIGETAVALELLKKGYDVININYSFQNYKNADLVCMNPETGKSVMIQVKTGTTHNILTGFTSELDGTIPNIDTSFIGPWVFVYIPKENYSEMKFYILSKDEVKELITSSNHWYVTEWNRELKSKPIVGVNVEWLEGNNQPGKSTQKYTYPEYQNPLGSHSLNGQKIAEDRWDKIEDLLR
ncbi:MAG: hypothetical protein IKX36_03065 [Prevotella sp.]|nr:hypothetical protein [Prevotella sp.]